MRPRSNAVASSTSAVASLAVATAIVQPPPPPPPRPPGPPSPPRPPYPAQFARRGSSVGIPQVARRSARRACPRSRQAESRRRRRGSRRSVGSLRTTCRSESATHRGRSSSTRSTSSRRRPSGRTNARSSPTHTRRRRPGAPCRRPTQRRGEHDAGRCLFEEGCGRVLDPHPPEQGGVGARGRRRHVGTGRCQRRHSGARSDDASGAVDSITRVFSGAISASAFLGAYAKCRL